MLQILELTSEYQGYCRDESRSVGYGDTISFPETEEEVCQILCDLYNKEESVPITVQGGRTGVAGAAVPYGGHVMNLSKMNHFLGMRKEENKYYLRVQPGVVLSIMRKAIEDRNIPTKGWDEAALLSYRQFAEDREYFFPTDPTESSACIGGIASCNASGARSYRYGAARGHIRHLRVALCDGVMLDLPRGKFSAEGRELSLVDEAGREYHLNLPTYQMPHTKNASGYYVEDDMDAIDVFIGSDGTLGVITEIEVELIPLPSQVWGISCFFESEMQAVDFTIAVRNQVKAAVAIEYFDTGAIDILRKQKAKSSAFAGLPEVEAWVDCCVFVELSCDDVADALASMKLVGEILLQVGGHPDHTWVARTAIDKEKQQFFRHAVPESTNMLIDERKRLDPVITKLGADMSVPDAYLKEHILYYRKALKEQGLETAIWGHIGNNHLHVNVLPRDGEDYLKGKELFKVWAKDLTAMGGAVSAEHGVGKLKRDFLTIMYGEEHIEEMVRMKLQLDPKGIFGRGNLFAPERMCREGKGEML